MKRREFLMRTGGALAAPVALTSEITSATSSSANATSPDSPASVTPSCTQSRSFNGRYEGEYLNQIAFPLGGIGAGMFCVDGNGALTKFSFRHRPELERERRVFAAISIKGRTDLARALEGRVPAWKLRPQFPDQDGISCWGLPRFHEARFEGRFPFATASLSDPEHPLQVTLTAWSPFSPGDADNASLPVAGLEYQLVNRGPTPLDALFSFNAENFLARPTRWPPDEKSKPLDRIRALPGGFLLYGAGSPERPWDEGSCAIWVEESGVSVDYAWPLDSLELFWRHFAGSQHATRDPQTDRSAAGASLFLPLILAPGEAKLVTVKVAWYVPRSNLYEPTSGIHKGKPIEYLAPTERYQPWYAGRFSGIEGVIQYWRDRYSPLRQASEQFSRAFFDSTLPPEVIEAVAANLSILKSPTVLRQTDGRLWGWEGSTSESEGDDTGISGTSTHVWNYTQSIPHLFPALERGLRETEFGNNQNDEGLQYCRTPLPIRPVEPGHNLPDGPACDGQLGGIVKTYREWRISGDTEWLRKLWPRVRQSLDYCIRTWDPKHCGWTEEPHLTTYDADFWGPDSFCTSLYLGALKAVTLMAAALGESADFYLDLLRRGTKRMESELFNGEYFFQRTEWKQLRATFPPKDDVWALAYTNAQDRQDLEQKEGPFAQCGIGCLSDGVMGAWLSLMSGLDDVLDRSKAVTHLRAVRRYNLKQDLTWHANFVRSSFACNDEAGLVLCTWPKGGRPSVPMVYSDEVWTGIEYQVASHLIALGEIDAGLDIVRAARKRYDGRVRNPFCEVEAGCWYARAMSSYALLQAFSGARFDAVEKVLYLRPAMKGDFRCFLSTATGYGTVGVRNGQPFVEVISGYIPYSKIEYSAA